MQWKVTVTIGDGKYTEETGGKKYRTKVKSRRNTHAIVSGATATLVVYWERTWAARRLLTVSRRLKHWEYKSRRTFSRRRTKTRSLLSALICYRSLVLCDYWNSFNQAFNRTKFTHFGLHFPSFRSTLLLFVFVRLVFIFSRFNDLNGRSTWAVCKSGCHI